MADKSAADRMSAYLNDGWSNTMTLTSQQAVAVLRARGTVSKRGGTYTVNLLHGSGAQTLTEQELIALAEEKAPPFRLEAPATLSPPLQDYARSYLAAQKRSGDALLEAAGWLARARAEARYGEWGTWLEATRTSEGTAKRLLDIHQAAQADPQFAEAVRSNWLTATAAAELAQPSTPVEVRQRLLEQEEAPTRADVQRARAGVKSATVADLDDTPTKTDADHVASIRRYLEQQRRAGRIHDQATYKAACDMASAIPLGEPLREDHQSRAGHGYGGRRCLACANEVGAARCGEPGCKEDSIGSRNIAGIKQHRCARHAQEAEHEQQNDILRSVCERAERCGATVNYLRQGTGGRVSIIPPAGYQQAELWCNAAELEDLCVAWERHAQGGSREQEEIIGIDWSRVDRLALNLGTARDAGRALDGWFALGRELLCASPDPRADAARLLQMLAPLARACRTEQIEELSMAISNLNECREGEEARHWIAVGRALLDLEREET